MATSSKKNETTSTMREKAAKLARSTQRPGQTKEQTRLITQGIQKGIEQYKKQQKAKARALDKKLKKVNTHSNTSQSIIPAAKTEPEPIVCYRQHWLPWALLAVSWVIMGGYLLTQ